MVPAPNDVLSSYWNLKNKCGKNMESWEIIMIFKKLKKKILSMNLIKVIDSILNYDYVRKLLVGNQVLLQYLDLGN